MTEGFLRQRRNLFVVNVIFLFCYYAQVNVSKLSIAGMSFEGFGNADAVYAFLWIAWAYFIYRFCVFFLEDEKSTFIKVWQRELEQSASKAIKSTIQKEDPGELNEGCSYSYYLLKSHNWVLHYQKYWFDEKESRNIENKQRTFKRRELILAELKGVVYFTIFTPILTNYLLPIILSVYVLFVCGFLQWDGNFVQAIT